MNKLSKEKRNQLIMVMMLTGGVLAGLYFGLIGFQRQGLESLTDQRLAATGKLDQVQRAKNTAQIIETDLEEKLKLLGNQENDMASGGDLYSSMINFIRKFQTGYRMDIPQFTDGGSSDLKLFPKFPYRQVSLSISGSGFYHDIGKFISDFENRFPSSQILNLELMPNPVQVREDREKLSFKMDVVTLIKSDS